MGTFLMRFLAPLGDIQPMHRKSSAAELEQAWQADVIWLSVPREAIDMIVAGRKLRPEQLIVDICSLKRRLHAVIAKTGAAHLSLHPLHGSSIPLNGQRWAQIPTEPGIGDHPQARTILGFLEEKGVTLLPADSEDHHDFMLGLTLSLPEIVTVVLEDIIAQYVQDNKMRLPSRAQLMQWAVPASNAIFSAYNHSINSTASWLRKDLACEAYGGLLASVKRACARLGERLSEAEIKERFERQATEVQTIPAAERERIRRWLEDWFADSTKTFFKREQKKSTKPSLNVQWREELATIFPAGEQKITVGIHGIEGCFTHEALLRFCEEEGYDSGRLELRFLVTAENVLRAVTAGEIDRGIFAMANSGSGAYVTSMGPMGNYQFEVLAVVGMEIMQCLLAHPSSHMEDIDEIFGHPQAVSQCKRTLAENYPHLKLTYGADSDDTALCAKKIAAGELPRTTATLASQIAAKLYGLNVLSYSMHHDPYNTTTFLIVKKPG